MCCMTQPVIPKCLSPGETPGVYTARPDADLTVQRGRNYGFC